MADKESNQRRSTRQERALYQAGPKNEQRSKLTHSRDASASSVSAKLGTPPAPVDPPGKVDPMEAVGKKLAEMSMRGPPGYFSRASNERAKNYQERPYINNNNTKNNNHQINNYTTNNNRNGHHHSDDFGRHHSTDNVNGGSNAGGRFNNHHGSRDNWNSRSNGRSNDRQFSMPDGGFHDRGSRNDEGRNSFQGDNHRNFNSRNSHYESSDRLRGNQNDYDGGRSDRYRDAPGRNQESHDHQDRGDRQGNWRSGPRQNDGGNWRRGPNSQQGDFQRGFRDNHRRLLNGSRDSLHSISSARSNDSRMKRGSPVNNHSQNQSRNPSESTADSPKNWIDNGGRRTPRNESESQDHVFSDQPKRGDRPRRDRRKRSRSQNKKTPKSEQQDGNRPQEPSEPAEQSSPRIDWCELADENPVQLNGHDANSDSHQDGAQAQVQSDPIEQEVAKITEKAPEKPSRIDWTECPTPPPLEDTCAPPPPVREPTPEPPEIEVKISSYPEESWRNPRSRQTSESSSGQTSNCSGFRKWDRPRDGRNPGPRGGRRSPPRDDFNYSSFHRRAPSPGSRYQESRDRRPPERFGNSQGKRYSTFQDSLPPRFRKQKENRV